jgi:hypothetical protein
MKKWSWLVAPMVVIALLAAPAIAGNNKGGGGGVGKGGKRDTTPPTITIENPSASQVVQGSISVSGTASDNVGIAQVAIAFDGGAFSAANGDASWTDPMDTTALPDGSHSIMAKATDAAGNSTTSSVTVTVENASPDTTPPKISFTRPNDGVTVSGVMDVSGAASDDVGVASVKLTVDGQAQAETGTTAWSGSVDTTKWSDGAHTIAAIAHDAAGNATTATVIVTFSNSTQASSGSSTSSGSTSDPNHTVTPEGLTIDVNSAGPWTAQQIYDLLKPSALQLNLIGPHLTIKVQDTYGSQTTAAASKSGGIYTGFTAIIYLKGVDSTFAVQPDAQIAHEYGHAWTLYHLYINHNGDWSSYLQARWSAIDGSATLATDPRLDSSYTWDRKEIIADDYRLLFGDVLAISERPAHLNLAIPRPADVSGLRSFLLNSWGAPG